MRAALLLLLALATSANAAARDERAVVMQVTQDACAAFRSGDLASLLYAEVNRTEVTDIVTSSLVAHQAIADAVVKGHTRKAVSAVVAHLDDVERRMVERLL